MSKDKEQEVEREEVEEYRLGVIDFLTKYGVSKMAERNFKSFKYERKALSVAPPDEYAARLLAFMEGICVGDAPPSEGNGGYFIEVTLKENNAVTALELANSTDSVVSSRAEEQWLRASKHGSMVTADSRLAETKPAAVSLKGSIISAVQEGSEPWRCDIRVGDRVHRINGELIPLSLNCKQVSEKMKRASRPVYLTLERLPTVRKATTSFSATHPPVPTIRQVVNPPNEDTKEDEDEELPEPPPNPLASPEEASGVSKPNGEEDRDPFKIASGSAEVAMSSALDNIQAITGNSKP
jgi:hypothetical protein